MLLRLFIDNNNVSDRFVYFQQQIIAIIIIRLPLGFRESYNVYHADVFALKKNPTFKMVGIAYFAVIAFVFFHLPDTSIAEKDTVNDVVRNIRGENELGIRDNRPDNVEYNKIISRIKKVGAPHTGNNVPVYYCKYSSFVATIDMIIQSFVLW